MRKTILKPLLAIVCLLSSITLYAHDFEVDGIYYRLLSEENQVTVTYYGDDEYDVPEEYKYTGSVTIPETVTYQGATYSVTSIGAHTFESCPGLTEVTIGNSVTSIGDYAFFCSYCLTEVTIPNSVTSIGYEAFAYCDGLTEVTIGNSVTSIGERAFNCCSGLTEITIPNNVTSIGDEAFAFCSSLNEVTIGSSVTSIGERVFMDCTGLTEVTIPNSVTSIGEFAFYSCTGLTSITLPNSVTSIDGWAFNYCTGLTEVTIGNSVTSIGESAFGLCYNIKTVNCYAQVPPSIYDNTFYMSENDNITLHVQEGCKEAYEKADYWNRFFKIYEDLTYTAIEDVTCDNIDTLIEYYDLNGFRVKNPTHGIYIMKQGNTVRKVVL